MLKVHLLLQLYCRVYSCDYICPPFLLSQLQGDKRVKNWTDAKRGWPTMQLKLLQAKQEETQGATEEEKEEKKK